jgi:nicotinic acid phosphoribosyltransferase
MGEETKIRPAGLKAADTYRSGSDLERRFPVALALYAVLAVLVWFTLDEGKVFVLGKWVELRWFPLLILGGLALRTVLARQADRIRRRGEKGGSSTPGSL